jgi:epsilon-lactone hydrolase
VVFAGESAGAGLTIATLVNAREHGLPLPAAALVMSPYVDLTLAAASIETRRKLDPLLSRQSLQARIPDYTAGQDGIMAVSDNITAVEVTNRDGSHTIDPVTNGTAAITGDLSLGYDLK